MITTIPINHVICPACLGGGLWLGNISIPCTHCDGEGLILNPLIADWERSESPAAMVEMLGDVDEKRRTQFVEECRRISGPRGWLQPASEQNAFDVWIGSERMGVPLVVRCDLLRCLWPNPNIERERVECPECDGGGQFKRYLGHGDYDEIDCGRCKGVGTIPAPIIDPQLLTCNVLGVARTIRGGDGMCSTGECEHNNPPRYDLMPILGDALLDAGLDESEPLGASIMAHCRAETHVAGQCWLIEEIFE